MEDRAPAQEARPVELPASVAIVGAGIAARALGPALRASGRRVLGVCARDAAAASALSREWGVADLGTPTAPAPELVQAGIVLVAVRDEAIACVGRELASAGGPWTGRVALHLSGSLESGELSALRRAGASVASWHPLATLGAGVPPGLPFFAEGDTAGVEAARELTSSLKGRFAVLPAGSKPAYHAAATLAGNLVAVLYAEACAVLRAAGIANAEAVLAPLAHASLQGAVEAEGLRRLTGPVARADARTVALNVAALEPHDAALRAAHAALSLAANERLREEGRGDAASRDAIRGSLLAELRRASMELR